MFQIKSVLARALVLGIIFALGCAFTIPEARAVAIEFATVELPWAAIGKPYAPAPLEIRASGACPLGGVGFAVVSGILPPGVQLSRLGYFSGIASGAGSYEFTIRAANGCSWTTKRFTIVVSDPPVLNLVPAHVQFQAVAGEGAPPEKIIRVSSAWPRVPYEIAITGADWLKALPDQGRASVAGDPVKILIDSSGLKAGYYSATISFSAWQAAPATVFVEVAVLSK